MIARRTALWSVLKVGFAAGLIWMVYWLHGNVWFRIYPAVMVLAALIVFVVSLFRTPVAETWARRMGESLDARGVEYCRKATVAWSIFLVAHFGVTLATVFADEWIWALYNGCFAYFLLGGMFVGEWIVRRSVRRG